jgi:branched-subunit amino acid aminotransferase/4-amino-4-deoxychorismate lyase
MVPNEPIVYLNDRFLPASQAKLNIYDLGIVLGATLTEMTRTFRHRPFRAEEHVSRLYRSLKFSDISITLTPKEMLARTNELAEANCKLLGPGEDIGIVHFVTPGENALYAGSAGSAGPLRPTICIHSFPLRFEMWRHAIDPSHSTAVHRAKDEKPQQAALVAGRQTVAGCRSACHHTAARP